MLIALNKPYGVISQFTSDGSKNRTLAEIEPRMPRGVYPIGRLDADSEGLLLLSDEGEMNARLLRPEQAHGREYWVQVERVPDEGALAKLRSGVVIEGRRTLPCGARVLEPQPTVEERDPPIRFRKTVPTCWVAMELVEGKNRQVRRMTAAVGFPTLRLMRVRIGGLVLSALGLGSGEGRELDARERGLVFARERGR
ncbi:MAG: pseudouridine synthase [Phycisphaerae bacterium]